MTRKIDVGWKMNILFDNWERKCECEFDLNLIWM